MTGCAMKSEAIGAERIKTEGRQPIHRWRMSKMPPIVNGAEDNVGYADGEEIMVRQANPANLAAAVMHDHIPCTKSGELRKLSESKDDLVNQPLTDHRYANYNEKPKGLGVIATVSPTPPEINDHVRCLEEIVLSQLDLIGKQSEIIFDYQKKIQALGKKFNELSNRVSGCDSRMCVVKPEDPNNGSSGSTLQVGNSPSDNAPQPPVSYPAVERSCLTKCCGRGGSSKYPARSLKRRNMVFRDKSSSSKRAAVITSSCPRSSTSESYVKKDDEKNMEINNNINLIKPQALPVQPVTMNFKKPRKKRGRKPRIATWKDDFLHTDKPYFLADFSYQNSPLASAETTIHVPSWRPLAIASLYVMEGTENIDDSVFQKRHRKYEAEEKLREKRDLQQQRREINVQLKLHHKRSHGMSKDFRGRFERRSISLYPSPSDLQYIEVTDLLPVIAFGHLIPVFQPSEFSLPWSVAEPMETVESPGKGKVTCTSVCGQKVT